MKDSKEILDITKEILKELRASFDTDLTSILFIVFLILKLTGVIDWSWWWVTAPLWAGPALFFGIIAIVLCLGLVGLVLYGLYELINLIFNKY